MNDFLGDHSLPNVLVVYYSTSIFKEQYSYNENYGRLMYQH